MAVTAVVVIITVADVAPAGIVTLACTVAFVLFEDRLIPTPPTAAGPVKVIVAVVLVPPFTVVGERAMLAKAGGLIVRADVLEALPNVAVIVAVFAL